MISISGRIHLDGPQGAREDFTRSDVRRRSPVGARGRNRWPSDRPRTVGDSSGIRL